MAPENGYTSRSAVGGDGSTHLGTTMVNKGIKISHSPTSSTTSSQKKGSSSLKDNQEDLVCSKIDSSDDEASEGNVDERNTAVDAVGDKKRLIQKGVPPRKEM